MIDSATRWISFARVGLGLALLIAVVPARSELTVEITQGVSRPIPVAIVPFAGADSAPVNVSSVIEADLHRSGRFDPLPRKSMLRTPSTASEVDFSEWRLLKTDYLVIGRMTPGANPAVQFELFNVLTGARILGYSVPVGSDYRLAAHRAADFIYQGIVGVRGAFATRIAYVAADGPINARRFRLLVADSDGENAHAIVQSREPLMSPAWSPDGEQLAYVSFEGRASSIWIQTLRSGERRKVSAREGINGAPAFSPDGKRLALAGSQKDGNVDVYVLDLSSGQYLRVTDDPAIDTEPAWSPDGKYLYFTSDRAGRPQIYKIGLAPGQKPQRITFEGSYNARPRPSPDGTQLAVVTVVDGQFRIGVIDAQSGRGRVLTQGSIDVAPSFAPNGQTLIYASHDQGREVLATVSVDGSVATHIVSDEGDVREPAWSPFASTP
jgi:TolB protein